MGLEAQIEALKRQNRRLKVALFSTITVLLVAVATAAGFAGIAAARARAEELRAREMAEQARAHAQAALAASQAELEEVIQQATASHPPPRIGSRRLRVFRAHQDEAQPATFVLEVNDPRLVHFSYQRYLENKLRQAFRFRGVPLRLIFVRPASKIGKRMEARTW